MVTKVAPFETSQARKDPEMAIATFHRPARLTFGALHAGGVAHLVRNVSQRLLALWRRRRVERELEGMPFALRKDIGFRAWDKNG